ncbi:MAG: signal peptide peptidase SppA [Myxococcota bacterium]
MSQKSVARFLPVVAGCVALLGAPGCITIDLAALGDKSMRETVIAGQRGPKLALIEVDGLLTAQPDRNWIGVETQSTVGRVKEQLDMARRDDDVRAVLLRIDTPGGTATASELLYHEVLKFKKERGIPVHAQLMGTATSGGYYLAMATDRVVAHPTTITGSIGVIFVGVEISGLMSKLGISDQTVTGGKFKDAGSPLRPRTPAEMAHFQAIIDDLHEVFRDRVDRGRPGLDRAQVDALADGRIFSAPQARDAGLVDAIGSIDDTVDAIRNRLGASEIRVVRYHRPQEWRRTAYDRGPEAPVLNVDLGSLLQPPGTPGFHYLWWPGAH